MGEPFDSFAIIEGETLSLQEAADVAKRDVGVVADVRPEKVRKRERERTGNEDDDPAVSLADSLVEGSRVFQWLPTPSARRGACARTPPGFPSRRSPGCGHGE